MMVVLAFKAKKGLIAYLIWFFLFMGPEKTFTMKSKVVQRFDLLHDQQLKWRLVAYKATKDTTFSMKLGIVRHFFWC